MQTPVSAPQDHMTPILTLYYSAHTLKTAGLFIQSRGLGYAAGTEIVSFYPNIWPKTVTSYYWVLHRTLFIRSDFTGSLAHLNHCDFKTNNHSFVVHFSTQCESEWLRVSVALWYLSRPYYPLESGTSDPTRIKQGYNINERKIINFNPNITF